MRPFGCGAVALVSFELVDRIIARLEHHGNGCGDHQNTENTYDDQGAKWANHIGQKLHRSFSLDFDVGQNTHHEQVHGKKQPHSNTGRNEEGMGLHLVIVVWIA